MQAEIMQARMGNPAVIVPDAMEALMALGTAAKKGGVPSRTLDLVHLRASQINGCSFCVDMHARDAKKAGETDERLFAVAAWREAPYFTGAERAALALAEAVTRLNDRTDPVPDEIWDEADPALRRSDARRPDPLDRHGQPLEPPQCPHQAGCRRVDRLDVPGPHREADRRLRTPMPPGVGSPQQQV